MCVCAFRGACVDGEEEVEVEEVSRARAFEKSDRLANQRPTIHPHPGILTYPPMERDGLSDPTYPPLPHPPMERDRLRFPFTRPCSVTKPPARRMRESSRSCSGLWSSDRAMAWRGLGVGVGLDRWVRNVSCLLGWVFVCLFGCLVDWCEPPPVLWTHRCTHTHYKDKTMF